MQELSELIDAYRWAVSSTDTEAAIEAIINRISPEIYLFVLGRVEESSADDVHSKALKEIANSLPTCDSKSSPEAWGWCLTITRRQVAKFHEAAAKKPIVLMDPSLLAELIDAGRGEDLSKDEAEELRKNVQDALRKLRESDPDCFLLLWDRFIVGMTFPEMGTEREEKPNTVRMRTAQCLEKIEPLLT